MRERPPTRQHRDPTLMDRIGGAVDALVGVFSPKRQAERNYYRLANRREPQENFSVVSEENKRLRGDKWLASRLSPQSEIEQDLETLVRRSREIYRDDAVGAAIDQRVDHAMYTPFKPQAQIKASARLGITEEQAARWNTELEELWEMIEGSMDRSRRRSVWQLMRLAERHNGFDGEDLTIMSDIGDADRPIPLALEVIDTRRLSTPDERTADPRVRSGVEFDEQSRIVAYWIEDSNPGDTLEYNPHSWTQVDASRVLHCCELWFAETTRGQPWMRRTLNPIKDARDFSDHTLNNADIASCYAAFVKTPFGGPDGAMAQGSGQTDVNGKPEEDIAPGMIRYLDPGEEVIFGSPNQPTSTFEGFMGYNNRRIAASINWAYELLMSDWRGTSFAGGRLAMTQPRLTTKVAQRMRIEQWLQPIWRRVVQEAVILGAVTIPIRLYEQMPWHFQRHLWIPSPWPYALTPGEEINADIAEVEANLATLAEKIAARGGDIETVLAQRAREVQQQADLQITPAPMPGAPAPEPTANEPEPEPVA